MSDLDCIYPMWIGYVRSGTSAKALQLLMEIPDLVGYV
jgi:hypothetical protein